MRYLWFATTVSAQSPSREPAVNDTLQSPEVSSDHHVTFRIFAPKASEVTLTGDWLRTQPAPKPNKDERGVGSITLGPFEPGIYIHAFTVDGVAIADPVNPRIKLLPAKKRELQQPAYAEPVGDLES